MIDSYPINLDTLSRLARAPQNFDLKSLSPLRQLRASTSGCRSCSKKVQTAPQDSVVQAVLSNPALREDLLKLKQRLNARTIVVNIPGWSTAL